MSSVDGPVAAFVYVVVGYLAKDALDRHQLGLIADNRGSESVLSIVGS